MSFFDWWKNQIAPVDAQFVALDQDMRAPAHAAVIPNQTIRAWLDFFVSWRNWLHDQASNYSLGLYVPFADPAALDQWEHDLGAWRAEFERLTGSKPAAPATGPVANPAPSAGAKITGALAEFGELVKWALVAVFAHAVLSNNRK